MPTTICLTALVLLTALPVCSAAQPPTPMQIESLTPADSTPKSVVRQHLRATIRQDSAASIAPTHPDELARTRAAFLPIFARDTTGLLATRVFGQLPPGGVEALPDAEFHARLFGFHVALASQGSALDRFTDVEILAVARPSPDMAYMIYRWVLPPAERPLRGANVTELRWDQGRWWLVMLGDLEGLRELLAAQ